MQPSCWRMTRGDTDASKSCVQGEKEWRVGTKEELDTHSPGSLTILSSRSSWVLMTIGGMRPASFSASAFLGNMRLGTSVRMAPACHHECSCLGL